ncbi:hypothetical protein FOZ62_004119 [Perkinsus olseni]|uniref:Nucleotide-diphospho-sugar transferase domain-containing protein n=1 Tax=Perkinsus olseni TaxID=32597 RepID=A0A7J6RN46_PEROL|nr:hypothetical protein FOZ62_004119 [Perkinsus olseni]
MRIPIIGVLSLLATASEKFPDVDCRNVGEGGVIDWDTWREELNKVDGLEAVLNISKPYIQSLLTDREQGRRECPVGTLMADVVLMIDCWIQEVVDGGKDGTLLHLDMNSCYYDTHINVKDGFSETSFKVILGTEWPIMETLNSQVWWHEITNGMSTDSLNNCEDITDPILDWPAYAKVFLRSDWYQPSLNVAYGPEMEARWTEAFDECPLGFLMANIVKGMICAHTESICFNAHCTVIDHVLANVSPHVIGSSKWPVYSMLVHMRKVLRRHRYKLDFIPGELENVIPIHERSLGDEVAVSLSFAGVMAALWQLNPDTHIRYLERAKVVGIEQFFVFTLDEEAYEICRKHPIGLCVRGTPSILNKFTLPLVLLHAGIDVLWMDFDVFMFQNPVQAVLEQNEGFDVMTASSFAADCVCSGVVYLRATTAVREWWLAILSWVYRTPYEHDQKTISAFLGAGERVAWPRDLPVSRDGSDGKIAIPKWGYLEAGAQFVSSRHVEVGGWTGDPDDIVLLHFLHGDSDDTVKEKVAANDDREGVHYNNLLEAFYGVSAPPVLFEDGRAKPHEESERLRELMFMSRWAERPKSPRRICNGTIPMRY